MLLSFSEGFLLGLGAAVPLGPINILIMNEATKSYSNAFFIGLGAMSADFLYISLIFFGLVAFVNQSEVLNILSLFGGGFLIYLAYSIFKKRNAQASEPSQKMKHSSYKVIYVKGFILTALSPYTIGFWLSVSSYIAAKDLDIAITFTGLFCALFLWISLMPYFVHRSKHKISQKLTRVFSTASAFILFCFGIMMLINLLIS